jgi:hypothetical protein
MASSAKTNEQALGTTVAAHGTSGQVLAEPSPIDQQIHDNPGTIKASTAIETLFNLLFKDYIFKGLYTISTDMAPGQIIWKLPIHPAVCNQYNDHVRKMFNVWTGGMKMRYKLIGTAFYGGSIRISHLPPNISEEELALMTVETLTAYPSMDLDPKNTNWVEFYAADQRNVLYHYQKDFNQEIANTFGGWVVCYVVGPLVTQDPAFKTIQSVLEIAGDFQYRQPNPMFNSGVLPPPADQGPLAISTLRNLQFQPLIDNYACDPDSGKIVILPSEIRSLSDGIFSIRAFNDRKPDHWPNSSWNNWAEGLRTLIANNTRTHAISAVCINTPVSGVDNIWSEMNPTNGSAFGIGVPPEYVFTYDASNFGLVNFTTKTLATVNSKASTGFRGASGALQTLGAITTCFDEKNELTGELTPSTYTEHNPLLPIMRSDESVVMFQATVFAAIGPQTLNIAEDLKVTTNMNESVSFVYSLRSSVNPNINLAWIRLNPNGLLTTNATKDTVSFEFLSGVEYYLHFEQKLDMGTPLPQVPTKLARRQRRWMKEKTQLRKEKKCDMDRLIDLFEDMFYKK